MKKVPSLFLCLLLGTSILSAQLALIINAHDGTLERLKVQSIINLLEGEGYKVKWLGNGNATWEMVKKHAQGVNILIYSGHRLDERVQWRGRPLSRLRKQHRHPFLL